MIGNLVGFVELGGIVLAWIIFWNFLIRGFTANHSNSTWAQGLAAAFHA
jgi:hypothetical protein